MRLPVLTAILSLTLAAPQPGTAAELSPDIAQRHINCTCRANGRSYHVGERICLSTAKGYRVAQCQMQQNVTNWLVSPEDCSVSSALSPRWPGPAARS